jgi:phosphatidylglycerol lysyltransferase
MFFFNKEIEEKQGIDRKFIYYASTIFSICSIVSSVLIAIPAVILLFLKHDLKGDVVTGSMITFVIIALLIYLTVSIAKKGYVFGLLQKRAPKIAILLAELGAYPLNRLALYQVLALSCIIEIIGVAQLYLAMVALNIPPSLSVAVIGYALVLIILLTSPFLRGIGAIEVSLTFTLTIFGFSAVAALSVAFLFRFFEFWSVLLLGMFALLFKKDGLFLQLLSPVLIFLLGIVNILSGLTPTIAARMKILRDFIPFDIIEVSNTTVIVIGLVLVLTSTALFRGLRNSFYLALFLTVFSFIGHLFKGIDYEEALFALFTMGILLYQRKEYVFRSPTIKLPKFEMALAVFLSVLAYGIGGFYLLEFKHFNENFTFWESVLATVKSIFLLNIDLNATTPFGKYFMLSLNMLGASSLLYLLWRAFKSFGTDGITDQRLFVKAKQMVIDFGNSSMDYFKTYPDKQLFFLGNDRGFVSYKSTKNYVAVLGNPVCKDRSVSGISNHIKAFEKFAASKNKKVLYYHIPEISKPIYVDQGKKLLIIGEDAFLNLSEFSLEGSEAKALRNAYNKISKSGYTFNVRPAPHNAGFLDQLALISDNWLLHMEREERCFSQGIFSTLELKDQTILTVADASGRCIAFLNLIPSIKRELNFDLIRKTSDAPNGTMDFLFISMIHYFKEKGFETLNMGMVPLSGIDDPMNFPEAAMQLAYERLKRFSHYKSLRSFKEKFSPNWMKIYIAYTSELDLVNLPRVLNKVMKVTTPSDYLS